MKLESPKRAGGTWSAVLEARDFPRRELIEPKLTRLGFTVIDTYRGTSASPFLAEALTTDAQTILGALSLHRFEFTIPLNLYGQKELAAHGVRFGFKDLGAWASFCRSVNLAVPQLAEADRTAYAAYLYRLIGQDRATGLQLTAVLIQISNLRKSPILSRGQIEVFLRLREHLGRGVDAKLVARFVAAFTLVEALELLGAKLPRHQLEQTLAIRCDLGYDASASELVSMLHSMPASWIENLLAEEVSA